MDAEGAGHQHAALLPTTATQLSTAAAAPAAAVAAPATAAATPARAAAATPARAVVLASEDDAMVDTESEEAEVAASGCTKWPPADASGLLVAQRAYTAAGGENQANLARNVSSSSGKLFSSARSHTQVTAKMRAVAQHSWASKSDNELKAACKQYDALAALGRQLGAEEKERRDLSASFKILERDRLMAKRAPRSPPQQQPSAAANNSRPQQQQQQQPQLKRQRGQQQDGVQFPAAGSRMLSSFNTGDMHTEGYAYRAGAAASGCQQDHAYPARLEGGDW
jgi:hypothetical protein